MDVGWFVSRLRELVQRLRHLVQEETGVVMDDGKQCEEVVRRHLPESSLPQRALCDARIQVSLDVEADSTISDDRIVRANAPSNIFGTTTLFKVHTQHELDHRELSGDADWPTL